MPKILVAESDHFFSKFYAMKLKQAGYEVDREIDGRKALKRIEEEKYDLILMNIMLPFKDGFTIMKKMKKTENSGIPVLIVSELNQEDDKNKAKELGASKYFVKNEVQITKIVKTVKDLLGDGGKVKRKKLKVKREEK